MGRYADELKFVSPSNYSVSKQIWKISDTREQSLDQIFKNPNWKFNLRTQLTFQI